MDKWYEISWSGKKVINSLQMTFCLILWCSRAGERSPIHQGWEVLEQGTALSTKQQNWRPTSQSPMHHSRVQFCKIARILLNHPRNSLQCKYICFSSPFSLCLNVKIFQFIPIPIYKHPFCRGILVGGPLLWRVTQSVLPELGGTWCNCLG